jgi:hypothetical protein
MLAAPARPKPLFNQRLIRRSATCGWFAMSVIAFAVQAQSGGLKATAADPLNPNAAVPLLRYESALKPTAAPAGPPVSWREANDTTARIGGWRVYARESEQAGAASDTASGTSKAPAASPAQVPTPSSSTPPERSLAEPKPLITPSAQKPGHAGHKMP